MSAAAVDYKPAILEALETMRLGVLATKEKAATFKANAYKKVMNGIRAHEGPITELADVHGLEGMGAKIKEKITEIIATGGLAAAERMRARTDVGTFELFLEIHGIGPVKARALIDAGYKSIADLRAASEANPKLLTAAQKMGLRFFEDARQRIPRAEMEVHEEHLLSALSGALRGTIVGSYRRGAATSGDIDLILTWPAGRTEADGRAGFEELLETIAVSGYRKGELASGASKWLGYVALPGHPVRRLDILLTSPAEHPYAILYFTGSDKFNIAFRRYCLSKGYTLNEHTLKPIREGVSAPPTMTKEADIFTFLGLKFIPPQERVDERQIVPL